MHKIEEISTEEREIKISPTSGVNFSDEKYSENGNKATLTTLRFRA